ncbi:hypothetical protein [Pararcticibacter amylolyticus]|uniref:DUF4296 domain-containing protein n=1 Tax=Pararcticibacter amylolyticus TaxID=2173175 RepID=A0A2U2PIT4_9SPHI|nr:hypothetical protein [Pararcticibacter amylolyticus]PWG81069.1 hypothetical protein DDR33_09085 [Pararcticibacter amylolyticus]
MKNKSNLKAILLGMLVLFVLSFNSCKKDQDQTLESKNPENIENFDKMMRFLTIMWGVDKKDINYDVEKQIFTLIPASYSMTLQEVQDYYAASNEYKLKYE